MSKTDMNLSLTDPDDATPVIRALGRPSFDRVMPRGRRLLVYTFDSEAQADAAYEKMPHFRGEVYFTGAADKRVGLGGGVSARRKRSGGAYCSVCRGPHVYKHGRA